MSGSNIQLTPQQAEELFYNKLSDFINAFKKTTLGDIVINSTLSPAAKGALAVLPTKTLLKTFVIEKFLSKDKLKAIFNDRHAANPETIEALTKLVCLDLVWDVDERDLERVLDKHKDIRHLLYSKYKATLDLNDNSGASLSSALLEYIYRHHREARNINDLIHSQIDGNAHHIPRKQMAARAAAFDKVQHALLPELDSILNINNHDLQKVGIKNNSAYARVCLSGESEAAEMAYRHFDKNKNNILDNEEVQKFIDTQKKNGKVKEITISNTDHDFVEVVFSNGTKQHMPVRLGDTVKTAHIMF